MIGRVKRLLPLVLLVCLGVGCGSSTACPRGVEIVLRAVPLHGQAVTPAGMQVARTIISDRVQTLGVTSPQVTVRGSDEIVIAYGGTSAPKDLARVVAATGQLQFFDFEKALAPPTVKNGNPTPYPTLYSLLDLVDSARSGLSIPAAFYLFGSGPLHRVLQGPAGTEEALLTPYRGKQPAGTTILTVPANEEVVSGPIDTPATKPVKQSRDGVYWYLFNLPAAISGRDLKESTISWDKDPNSGQPEVLLGFTRRGTEAFRALTQAEYERGLFTAGLQGSTGSPANALYEQHSAIVLDNKLQATPSIDYTDQSLSLGITGGMRITNIGSTRAAKDLALVLRSGSLPYRFEQVSSTPGCAR